MMELCLKCGAYWSCEHRPYAVGGLLFPDGELTFDSEGNVLTATGERAQEIAAVLVKDSRLQFPIVVPAEVAQRLEELNRGQA